MDLVTTMVATKAEINIKAMMVTTREETDPTEVEVATEAVVEAKAEEVTTRTNKADSSNAKVVNSSITSTSPSKLHQVCHNHQFKVLQVYQAPQCNRTKCSNSKETFNLLPLMSSSSMDSQARRERPSLVTASMLPFRELSAIRPPQSLPVCSSTSRLLISSFCSAITPISCTRPKLPTTFSSRAVSNKSNLLASERNEISSPSKSARRGSLERCKQTSPSSGIDELTSSSI